MGTTINFIDFGTLFADSRRKRWKWFILALAVSMTLVLLYVEEDKVAKQRCAFLLVTKD